MMSSQLFIATINTFTIRNKPLATIIANHTGPCNKNRPCKINRAVDLSASRIFSERKWKPRSGFAKTHSINKTDVAPPEHQSETKFAGRETGKYKSKKANVFLELQIANFYVRQGRKGFMEVFCCDLFMVITQREGYGLFLWLVQVVL